MFPASATRGLSERFSGLDQAADERRAESGESPARVRFVQLDDEAREFEYEFLSAGEAAAEDLMLACRLTEGASAERLRRLAGPLGVDRVARACGRAVELGLAAWTEGSGLCAGNVSPDNALQSPSLRFAPTHEGWLSGNVLFELFWELA